MYVKRLLQERKIYLHYIDLKNFENFKGVIKKFLVKTFLKKKDMKFIKKSKSLKTKSSSSFFKRNNSHKKEESNIHKKIIKSLSFNYSDGDGSN